MTGNLTRIILREIRFIDRFHSRFLLAIACNYQSNKAMCRQHDIRTETHRRSSRNNIQSPAWIASSIESLEGRPPPPSDSSELGYAGNIKPLKRCVRVMRTSFFSTKAWFKEYNSGRRVRQASAAASYPDCYTTPLLRFSARRTSKY